MEARGGGAGIRPASRSIPEAQHAGEDPRWLDRELVRRALIAQGYPGDVPPPTLDEGLRVGGGEAARRYNEIFELVTGVPFVGVAGEPMARNRLALRLLLGG